MEVAGGRLPARPDQPAPEYSVLSMVADVKAVIDEVGIDAPALVGHSLGATTAAVYAIAHSARAVVCVDLSVHGSPPAPDYADWLRSLVPDATVEVWEGHGHMLHLLAPDRFAEQVGRFVDATSAATT